MGTVKVLVARRHSADCTTPDKCRCRVWLEWSFNGKRFRQSAKTRSMQQATLMASQIEKRYISGEPVTHSEPETMERAVSRFLDDKRAQNLAPATIKKLEHIFDKQLLAWCRMNAVLYLNQLTLSKLEDYRNTWTDGPLAKKKKQERIIGFFHYCQRHGFIPSNPATGLSRVKVQRTPTDYFTAEEFAKIIEATYIYGRNQVEQRRLRALTLLMRWSGLAIRDAVTLERSRLDNDNQIGLHRAKTGEWVFVPIPSAVADDLRRVPDGPVPNPRYFFWSGNGLVKSVVADWQRAFRRLFKLAGITKRAHPHMFRDTFAVESLLAGISLDEVAMLLGHSSVKTTEKSYLPWVKARQVKLASSVRHAWANMPGSLTQYGKANGAGEAKPN